MAFDHFEQELNNKFKEFQPELDDTGMWALLEAELPSEKKDRKFFWILLGALLTGVIATGLWMSSGDNNSLEVTEVFDPYLSSTASTEAAVEEEAIEESIVKPEATAADNRFQPVPSSIEVAASEVVSIERLGMIEESSTDIIDETDEVSTVVPILARISNNMGSSISSKDLANEEDALVELQLEALMILPSRVNHSIFYNKSKIMIDDDHLVDQVSHLSPKVEVYSTFSISLGATYARVRSRMEARDVNAMDLLELRDQSNFDLESLNFEFRLQYRLSPNWSLITGLHYNHINEGARTIHASTTSDVSTDTTGIIYSIKAPEYILGNVEEITTSTITMNRYNHIGNVSIPIGFNYQRQISSSMSWAIGAVYELGVFNYTRGYEQDRGSEEYNISSDAENRFKSGGYNNLLLETKLLREIGDRSHFYLGLQHRMGLSNIYNNNYSIKKKFDLPGINVGISYSL